MTELNFNVRVGAIDADMEQRRRRKFYGRGFCDAARLCGREPGELMNEAKITRAEQALSNIEQKVYDCVPFDEAWNQHQITTEMGRTSGTHPDFRVVQGCLSDLLQRKLVREGPADHFQRMAPKRPTVVASIKPKPKDTTTSPTYVPPPMPMTASVALEKYGDLAKRMREFADEIDTYGIAVSEQLAQFNTEAERYRQLKALMGSV